MRTGLSLSRRTRIVEREDGSLLLRLCVCNDRPLRSWILSFGALACVVAPSRLAQDIFEEIQQARDRYTPRLAFEPLRMAMPDSQQAMLPLRTQRWKAS